MNSQAEFEFPVHQRENNPESESNLLEHQEHFSGKCILFLRRLVTGERLQAADEVKTIGDMSRRACDLIEEGIPVQRTFVVKERTRDPENRKPKAKEYWLKEEDIPAIKEKYAHLLNG